MNISSDYIEINNNDATMQLTNKSKRTRSTFPFGKCRICNDQATGFHYGVESCEGCKGFYKRSVMKNESYRCYFGNKCNLKPENRNRCKACRLKKCEQVGMSLNLIKMGRIPKLVREKVLNERNNHNHNHRHHVNEEEEEDEITSNNTIDLCEDIYWSSSGCSSSLSNLQSPSQQKSSETPQLNDNDVIIIEHVPCIENDLTTICDLALSILKKDIINLDTMTTLARNYIQEGKRILNEQEATKKMIWLGVSESLKEHVKCFLQLTRELPGLKETIYDQDLLTHLIEFKIYDYCMIKNASLAQENEFYLILPNGIHYTKKVQAKIVGDEMASKIFNFYKLFNALNFTQREYSLLIPYVFTLPNNNLFKENLKLCKLNEVFGRALAQELFTNKRSQLFVKNLTCVLHELSLLNRIERLTIRNNTPSRKYFFQNPLPLANTNHIMILHFSSRDCLIFY